MPALNAISPDKFARLLGTPDCPTLVDLRSETEVDSSGAMPASLRRVAPDVRDWASGLDPRGSVVVACTDGKGASPGVAAWLRHSGRSAETLEGGVEGWLGAGLPLIPTSKVVRSRTEGGSVWVTRARPKVDRIACPWLIRRFVDPQAEFLFVAPNDVPAVAEQFGAAPFDIDGVFWSHRGESCTFDVMVEEFGLSGIQGLMRLAAIVRGADTDRFDLAPQAAGLLAASLGLSRLYSDDLEQLEAGMLLYDAFYRWCRDGVQETHDWVSHQPKKKGRKA